MVFRSIPEYMDTTMDVFIDLEIDNATLPDFVSASLSRNQVSVDICQELVRAKEQVVLIVNVDETAPAFLDFNVKLKATARATTSRFKLVTIDSITSYAEVRMQPNYVPFISITEPEGNQFNVSSNSITNIPINITNLGNGPTLITFEIIDEPKDWALHIRESVELSVGEKTTENLTVKTDNNPNQRYTIQLKLTPSYYHDPTLTGDNYTLNFTVTSKGSVTEDINIGLILLIILIPVILFVVFIYYKSKPK